MRQKLKKRPQIFKDHRIAQLWNVKEARLLTDEGILLDKLLQIAKLLKLTVVNTFVHKFNPFGLSVILVIAESHLAVHTWPEHNYIHIDLFTCSPKTNIGSLKRILRKEVPSGWISVGKVQYL